MSWATPFFATSLPPDPEGTDRLQRDEGGYEGEGFESRWISRRVLSHRDEEHLGMWAARLKVMAGTQHLLPTIPTILPAISTHSHHHLHPHPYPVASYPSAPPASPLPLSARPAAAQRTGGIISDAAAACDKIMRLASTLERRRNAERRLARKNRSQQPPVRVVRPAAPSTVPAVGDDSPCREATVHPPRPAAPTSLNLVGALSDVPPSPSLPLPPDAISPQPPTFTEAGAETTQLPPTCDVSVDASLPCRSFRDAAVGNDDQHTTYGFIADPFARDLARLLPLHEGRERKLAQTIWLGHWEAHMTLLQEMPPFLRVYLHALFMFFRPTAPPTQRVSIPPGFGPVFNLFAHWWSAWNAVPTPYGPPEPDIWRRYYYLTDAQLQGTAPLEGRGFILEHTSSFL